jgi:hypothetical protein
MSRTLTRRRGVQADRAVPRHGREPHGHDDRLFAELATALREGDGAAWREVVGRCGPCLLALAQERLVPRLRPAVDPEDVVQSVYVVFFQRLRAGVERPRDWDDLAGLLAALTFDVCHRWRSDAARRLAVPDRRPTHAGVGRDGTIDPRSQTA